MTITADEKNHILEIGKCQRDIGYFAFKYIKTLDIETQSHRGFGIFNGADDRKEYSYTIRDYLNKLETAYKGKRKVLVYKRRQLYITTATLAWLLWHFIFDDNFKAVISTEKLGKADNPSDDNTQLGRFRNMLNSLPEWLRPQIEDKTGYLSYKGNTIGVEGGDHPGRAGQTSFIWADEFAFQPRSAVRYTSMLESCKGMILLTSTPNGKHNKFYELYDNPPNDMDIIDLPITLRRNDEWVQRKRDSYKGNEEGFEQEIMGSWGGGLKGRVFTYWSTDALFDYDYNTIRDYISNQDMSEDGRRLHLQYMALSALLLNEEGIAIRSGMHCAEPLISKYNSEGLARASFYIYNTKEDIDTFFDILQKAIQELG
jgi:hypothetical protein